MTLPDMPSAELVWGLFIRALGVVYFWAFIQLYHQVLPLAGRRGIQPVEQKLKRIREDYPGWRRWLYFPTLLWFGSGDRWLKAWLLAGAGAALMVVWGGPFSGWAMLACWLIYLSFDLAVGLTYPWDCLLLEAGFLAVFLPASPSLPDIALTVPPLPAVAWGFRWLFFRLLFGFGKLKFLGARWWDTDYFRNFMVGVPLPNYLGWYAHHLPHPLFGIIGPITFITEIVLPFGVFFTGSVRLLTAGATALLMTGIWLVSSFGFFNLLTIVLCLPLLDTEASLFDTTPALLAAHPVAHAVVAVLAVGGLIHLLFNSWCTLTWLHWPSQLRIRLPGMQTLLAFYRLILRFRVVHAYGVFPPTSGPPIRWVPVVEGSYDGLHWEPYEYRYMTTTETSPPRFAAPYHPRIDHGIFYEAFGTNDATFIWSTMGSGNPYDFSHTSGVQCLMQRLLEADSPVLSLFRHCPFPPEAPPTQIRIMLYRFQPTTPSERRRTGRWWTRTRVGTHLPPTRFDADIMEQHGSRPDRFHPDAVYWRLRAPQTWALHQLGAAGPGPELWRAIEAGQSITLTTFWQDFIGWREVIDADWPDLPKAVETFRRRYDRQQREELETLFNRLSLALLARLEPHFLGKADPGLPVDEYFLFALLTHHLIAQGPDVYLHVLEKPADVQRFIADFDGKQSFRYLSLFWFDTVVFMLRKFRITLPMARHQSGNGLPGFLELVPFLSQQFVDETDENLPLMRQDPATGRWSVSEKEPVTCSIDRETAHLPDSV